MTEEYLNKPAPQVSKVNEWKQKFTEVSERYQFTRRIKTIARVLVCSYFLNSAYTSLQIWYMYGQQLNLWAPFVLVATMLVMFDVKTVIFGSFLAVFAAYESFSIFQHQIQQWMYTGQLYINELMVKKLSLLGAIMLILAEKFQLEKNNTNTIAGIVLEAKKTMSSQKSAIMLVGRLLLSTLFLYVGINEIRTQIRFQTDEQFRNQFNVNDGHYNPMAKLLEFALCVPFVVGFHTNVVARVLSIVLFFEAFSSWAWFLFTSSHIGYVLHAREHFYVNIAVAGGVNFLVSVGAGKYTVDELLKKKE